MNISGRWVKQPRYIGDPDATPGVPHTVGLDVGGGSLYGDWVNVQTGTADYVMHKADSTKNGYLAWLHSSYRNKIQISGSYLHRRQGSATWVK